MATYKFKSNIDELELLIAQLKEILDKINSFEIKYQGHEPLVELSDPETT